MGRRGWLRAGLIAVGVGLCATPFILEAAVPAWCYGVAGVLFFAAMVLEADEGRRE